MFLLTAFKLWAGLIECIHVSLHCVPMIGIEVHGRTIFAEVNHRLAKPSANPASLLDELATLCDPSLWLCLLLPHGVRNCLTNTRLNLVIKEWIVEVVRSVGGRVVKEDFQDLYGVGLRQ